MTAVHLRVYGEPQPQGNKTAFVNRKTNKAVLVEGRRPEARENFRSWRGGVEQAARDWLAADEGRRPLDEPVALVATFWLSRPTSLPRWRWLPWTRPDLDKLSRALLDALSAIVIRDDARVVDLVVRKRYATAEPPGVAIVVVPLGEDERAQCSPSLSLLTSVIADLSERAEAVAR